MRECSGLLEEKPYLNGHALTDLGSQLNTEYMYHISIPVISNSKIVFIRTLYLICLAKIYFNRQLWYVSNKILTNLNFSHVIPACINTSVTPDRNTDDCVLNSVILNTKCIRET